jgi:primosomal protein N' (replication factor Y)
MGDEGAGSAGTLLEVAIAVPPFATFTYLDPRRDERVAVGAQVVVPLGGRRITGFVVGHPSRGPKEVRAIEEVLEAEPALDADVLWLCRWTAAYYVAPLGEVLRAALPQAERAAAQRRARLTEEGQRFLRRLREGKAGLAGLAFDDVDRRLLERLGGARGLGLRGLRGTVDEKRLPQLIERAYVEVGDEVTARVHGRHELWAIGLPQAQTPVFSRRERTRRELWAELVAAAGSLRLTGLSPARRAAAQAMAAAGLLRLEQRRVDPESPVVPAEPAPALNQHQAAAFAAMTAATGEGWKTFVLHGVTGSGKTEVYLRLIAEVRAQGKGALVLVPEIALTPQLAARFRGRFGDDVAVLHSGLAPAERRAAWRRLRAGEVGIALGARSAVFAPVPRLGVVVVDEEHDPSFKQEEGLRYNGRDLALVRAQHADAIAVLGSATPSLETYRQAETGRYQRLLLPTRANPAAAARPLPPVEIVDLRREPPLADGLFSRRLLDAVRDTVAAGEQVILFLNRRGFAPLVLCRSCGKSLRCTQCAVAMTFHRARGELSCHYCGAAARMPQLCPVCHLPRLEQLGTGTERAESVIREYLPLARVARLDRDTAGIGSTAGLERALAKVHRREIDILVGTQMVTKGHDFAGVTLVGVLLPDQGMNLPDFRAAERTFQLLEQVAGRAGRAERPGRVIIQSYSPEHPAIAALPSHDYEGFVRSELERRQEAGYPPFARLVALRLEGADPAAVEHAATAIAQRALEGAAGLVRVRGPAEAPIALLRGQTRWQVWLASMDRTALAACARRATETPVAAGVRVTIDVDPHSVL